jgi:hypothetical protein
MGFILPDTGKWDNQRGLFNRRAFEGGKLAI